MKILNFSKTSFCLRRFCQRFVRFLKVKYFDKYWDIRTILFRKKKNIGKLRANCVWDLIGPTTMQLQNQFYQLDVADTWFVWSFSWISAAASRWALISLTRSTTSGWLNFPSVLSKNSWCVLIQLSRFSYSNACITKSKRSKSLTNFDSGDCASSYSWKISRNINYQNANKSEFRKKTKHKQKPFKIHKCCLWTKPARAIGTQKPFITTMSLS